MGCMTPYYKPSLTNLVYFWLNFVCHILNEQRTAYGYLKSIELRNEARHLKEHPR